MIDNSAARASLSALWSALVYADASEGNEKDYEIVLKALEESRFIDAGYQRLIDGKWQPEHAFVAVNPVTHEIESDCRRVYALRPPCEASPPAHDATDGAKHP